MIEKVNPSHPDKIADRIAGAIIDLAYTKNENTKTAVEVLGNFKTRQRILVTPGIVELGDKMYEYIARPLSFS